MITAVIIACVFLTVTAYPTDSHETIGSICCESMKDCCMDKIKFGQPINCTVESEEWRQPDIMMLQCMGQRLNNESQWTDKYSCCDVFLAIDDTNEWCKKKCIETIRTPTLTNEEKIDRIRVCRANNTLLPCFHKCLKHPVSDGPFNRANCGLQQLMTQDSYPYLNSEE